MYGDRSVSSLGVRSFCCQLSGVVNYHGLAMSVVRYAAEYHTTKEQWVVVVAEEDLVNHGRTTSGNGQAS